MKSSVEMAGSVIPHAGYEVRGYGAEHPVDAIAAAVDRHRPSVVGFTTATVLTAVNLPAAFDAVRAVDPRTGIVPGGRAVEQAIAATWEVPVCAHFSDAGAQVDALIRRARHN